MCNLVGVFYQIKVLMTPNLHRSKHEVVPRRHLDVEGKSFICVPQYHDESMSLSVVEG